MNNKPFHFPVHFLHLLALVSWARHDVFTESTVPLMTLLYPLLYNVPSRRRHAVTRPEVRGSCLRWDTPAVCVFVTATCRAGQEMLCHYVISLLIILVPNIWTYPKTTVWFLFLIQTLKKKHVSTTKGHHQLWKTKVLRENYMCINKNTVLRTIYHSFT